MKGLGKTIALLFLVVILILLGLLWFDYIGVIQAKKAFSPVYKLLKLEPQVSSSITETNVPVNLDADRLAKRLESLDIRTQELDKREADITQREQQLDQIVQELDDRKKSQEDRELSFNNTVKKYDDRQINIEANARNLTGMQPEKAVLILNEMEDQDLIDVLRKTDEIAAEEGSMSMVSYWLSLMPADRVATVQRKMANKPLSIE
jgi:flagellar protein FlbB